MRRQRTKGREEESSFTDEHKAFTIDIYRGLINPKKTSYDFHREWVREYPSLTYFSSSQLAFNARKWMGKKESLSENIAEVGEQSELRKYRSRVCHFYTPEERAKILTIYQQTNPNVYGHSRRIYEKWMEEGRANDVDRKALREMIQRWMREDLKKKGKEPLLTPKTGVESGSPPSASDMSHMCSTHLYSDSSRNHIAN